MDDRILTPDKCDELAAALSQDARACSVEERMDLLTLAEAYRALAIAKRAISRLVN
jgi:hypothetical protein